MKSISVTNHGNVNIVCFHHCGGDASTFRELARSLVEFNVYAVIQPGRAKSRQEELITSVEDMAEGAAKALEARARDVLELSTLPTIFLGHSLGGIVAYETLIRLISKPQQQFPVWNVRHFITSSVRSPDRLAHINAQSPETVADWFVHLRDECGLVEHCKSMMSVAVDDKFILAKLHAIRGDFKAFETYRGPCNVLGQRARKIPCEITCFLGTDDVKVPKLDADDWDHFTSNTFTFSRFLGGGHFYLTDEAFKHDFHRRVKSIGDRVAADAMSSEETMITPSEVISNSLAFRSQELFPAQGRSAVNDAGHQPQCMPLFAPPAGISTMSTMPPMSPEVADLMENVLTAGSLSPMSPHGSISRPFTRPRANAFDANDDDMGICEIGECCK